ncbi:unnamed protein product, partial [Scytosiphon promiscuus]
KSICCIATLLDSRVLYPPWNRSRVARGWEINSVGRCCCLIDALAHMPIPNRALPDPSAVKPNASSGRSSASSISKEADRRLQLQQWREEKAMSDKKKGLSERAVASDREKQFIERRKRRILREEQEKKRVSGKENAPMAMPAADAHLVSKGATAQITAATRPVNTPNAGLAPEAQARLTGTTPISALRRPQSRPKPIATAIPAAGSTCAETSDSPTDTSGPATAPPVATDASAAIRAQTDCTTPSRRSALSRPKASPYKERKHPSA